MRLVLASASPRRAALLAQIGLVPDAILPAEIDETPKREEDPRHYAQRMAREKCACIEVPDTFVLAGDRVNVEMTPYDLSKGRITFRFK